MADSKRPFKVIIIGSGLAGALLANGLIKNGVEFTVYERLQRHAERKGYQIRLGAFALKGMRACLSPDHIKTIAAKFGRSSGMKSGAPVMYDDKFQEMLDLSVYPNYSKSAPISRGLLRDTLADPVFDAGRLKYGMQFERYEILNPGSNREQVRVWFVDGSFDDCDILIAADGSHSKVRSPIRLSSSIADGAAGQQTDWAEQHQANHLACQCHRKG